VIKKTYYDYRRSLYASINSRLGCFHRLSRSRLLKKDELSKVNELIVETKALSLLVKNNNIIEKNKSDSDKEPTTIERIICSAVWYKDQPSAKIQVKNVDRGVVLCGYRHGDAIHQFIALTGKRSVTTEAGEYVQGFLTNKNRFVDRTEAAMIFVANGGKLNYSSKELFSEDLY
jgi:hypothetical protein